MDSDLRQQMLAYYDQRAPEYEEAFTLGTGTASIQNPEVFKAEAPVLAGIVRRFGRGRIMDLACGTAVWLPEYAPNCSHITLFDQSDRMLREARAKVNRLGLVDRCVSVRGDLFDHTFEHNAYDTALVGFLLSHLTAAHEHVLFEALRMMLGTSGRFLILDSAWSPERAMVNHKVERQPRRLNDGTTFDIYKRYCDRDDIARWTGQYGVELHVEHFGAAFYAVSGAFAPTGLPAHPPTCLK
jgi:ubiquinone/menaquinone biosynthesis C-methylase UbiE